MTQKIMFKKIKDKEDKEKIVLIDQDNQPVYFDYAIDAREALLSKDEEGNQRYFMPKEKIPTKDSFEKIDDVMNSLTRVKEEGVPEELKDPEGEPEPVHPAMANRQTKKIGSKKSKVSEKTEEPEKTEEK